MNFIKRCIRHIFHMCVYGYKASSKTYIDYLRKRGAKIGEGAVLFDSTTITIDDTALYMLSIGKNFQCTGGVTILTHDYGWSVTKAVYGDVLGSNRCIEIGDNVYVGRNAMILAGAKIGCNVIIGANSVVTKEIPDNCVAVGNPCKMIYSLEKYHDKRKAVQMNEAVQTIRSYYRRYHCKPSIDIMSEYFWLFTNRKEDLPKHFVFQNNLIPGSEKITWKNFLSHIPPFKGYDDLVEYALKDIET